MAGDKLPKRFADSIVRHKAWHAAKAGNNDVSPADPQFSIARPQVACQTDLSTWFLDQQHRKHWPTLSHGLVGTAMREDFIDQYLSEAPPGSRRRPVDAIQTLGWLLLHELTHTVQGGCLKDIPDKQNCYGWTCVTENKLPDNADTIAVIGAALKLWRLGYWVTDDGYINSID
ncbi:hypothetical protein BDV96DRAFT_652458 [Lophiotrema nucula]|uniref:Uncharacterized protein n=1 Tax=Lophiotrema nucula TaxID=690887 RepID=A0A6A5YR13_9PLEO|nr:hypothetical protein BDV96DRAFT_652458 [Lophiotrema nucula]